MEKTDEFDIVLALRPHGWSSFYFLIRGNTYELVISHIFSEPYIDLINVLALLIKGEFETEVIWYGEPGGHKINFNRSKERQHEIQISVTFFADSYGRTPAKFEEILAFETIFEQFVINSYAQLKKIYLLMQTKQYSKGRENEFPIGEYQAFEKLLKAQFSKIF